MRGATYDNGRGSTQRRPRPHLDGRRFHSRRGDRAALDAPMKLYVYVLAFAMHILAGCSKDELIGDALDILANGPWILNGSPDVTDAQVAHVLELTAGQIQGLDLSRVSVTVWATAEEVEARCGKGVAACTAPPRVSDGVIVIQSVWDLTPSNWPASDSTLRAAAGNLAHELCHVGHFEAGGDGDMNHADQPCFGEPEPSGRYGGSSPENPTVYDRVTRAFVP